MSTNVETITPERFHAILHKDIDKPVEDFRKKWVSAKKRSIKVHTGAHKAQWAQAAVSLSQKVINVKVFLNFKKNDIADSDYERLKTLAIEGIRHYWSRSIKISGINFTVNVLALHRSFDAIPVDLYVEKDKNKYARSMNPAMLGIDASFIYNKGRFGNSTKADKDFMLVAAHEFGHSILMYAGGISLSWGHKGSTNPITQSVKSSTPGYPKSGAIDLMRYYDSDKAAIFFNRRIMDTIAMEIDVKRLIWGATIRWTK